jgi:tetratricopeptide (TPR) repeat protein
VLLAHYAGLRTVFADWQMPVNAESGDPEGGLAGVEKHYHDLSEHYGCAVRPPESLVNQLGYQLMGQKKLEEAIRAFQRNVELYPYSANVYDSLGDGYENAGKLDLAIQNVEKAVAQGVLIGDPNLDLYKEHLKRLQAVKAGANKTGVK